MFIIVLLNLLLAVNVYGVSSLTGDAMRLFISPSCSSVFFYSGFFAVVWIWNVIKSSCIVRL